MGEAAALVGEAAALVGEAAGLPVLIGCVCCVCGRGQRTVKAEAVAVVLRGDEKLGEVEKGEGSCVGAESPVAGGGMGGRRGRVVFRQERAGCVCSVEKEW